MGAWFGLISLIGGAQLVIITIFLSSGAMREILGDPEAATTLPPVVFFLLRHFAVIGYATIALFAFTALAAFGVCRRREWARLALLVALALQIALVFIGPAAVVSVIQSAAGEPHLPGPIGRIPYAYTVIMMLPSFVFAAAFGWFFYTLTRPHIREEFS